jgi:hypothetical protein
MKNRLPNGTFKKSHGYSGTKIHAIWKEMRHRCSIVTNHAFDDYGGRGINVCLRWEKFENFLEDMGNYPLGMTLERKNNSKGYSPENCYWASRKEQANNRRSSRILDYKGERKTLAQWTEKYGFKNHTLLMRLRRGWSLEKSLNTLVKKHALPEKQI